MTTMQKTSTTSSTLRSGLEVALPDGSGQALANAAEAWFSAAAECQREMMAFVSMRLEKDAETTREMMTCKDFANMAETQFRWIEETLRDYNAEMGKLMTICIKSANSGVGSRR